MKVFVVFCLVALCLQGVVVDAKSTSLANKIKNAGKETTKTQKSPSLIQSKTLVAAKEKAKIFISGTILAVLGIASLVMSGTTLGIKTWRAEDRLALETDIANAAGINTDLREHVRQEYNMLATTLKKCWNNIKDLLDQEAASTLASEQVATFVKDISKGGVATVKEGILEAAVGHFAFEGVTAALNAVQAGAGEFVPILGTVLSAYGLVSTLFNDDHRKFCDLVPGKVEMLKEADAHGKHLNKLEIHPVAAVAGLSEDHYQPAVDCTSGHVKIEKIQDDTAALADGFCLELYRNFVGYRYFAKTSCEPSGELPDNVLGSSHHKQFLTSMGVMMFHTRASICAVPECVKRMAGFKEQILKEGNEETSTATQKTISASIDAFVPTCADMRLNGGARLRSSSRATPEQYVAELSSFEGAPLATDNTLVLFTHTLNVGPAELATMSLFTKISKVNIAEEGDAHSYDDISASVVVSNPKEFRHKPYEHDKDPLSIPAFKSKKKVVPHPEFDLNNEKHIANLYTLDEQATSATKQTVFHRVRFPSTPLFLTDPLHIREGKNAKAIVVRGFDLTVSRFIPNWFDAEKGKMQIVFATDGVTVSASCKQESGVAKCDKSRLAQDGVLVAKFGDLKDGYTLDLEIDAYVAVSGAVNTMDEVAEKATSFILPWAVADGHLVPRTTDDIGLTRPSAIRTMLRKAMVKKSVDDMAISYSKKKKFQEI